MLALVSVRWVWTLAMLAADLSDPAWMAARMLASEGSVGGSAAAATGRSSLVGGSCRRGLVERRGLVALAPSRSGISLCEDAEMLCLAEGNEASNLSQMA